jgi:hypothetical protein
MNNPAVVVPSTYKVWTPRDKGAASLTTPHPYPIRYHVINIKTGVCQACFPENQRDTAVAVCASINNKREAD